MTETAPHEDDTPPDEVEALLANCLVLPPHQQSAAVQAACDEHPDLADDLRARFRALRALGLDQLSRPAEAPAAPDRLGDFDLIEPLGGGGMGIVYLARQRSLGRDVALKVMRPEGLFFADHRERFRREVEAIARLEHPGIVKVHAVGDEDGVPYFAMERIDGLTLAEVLRELADRAPASLSGRDLAHAVGAGPGDMDAELFALSWPDACAEIARRVAAALHHAHSQGIVHRDVKPSNVALTRDGRVQLFDFGLAGSDDADRLTRSGGQLGTLQYMAPEQLRGERELDARSDVYALGVTLYELLALQPPFEGDSRLSIETRILEARPPALRALNRRTPPELERVTARAMDLDRARRYSTAGALADDLRRVLERKPVTAQPPGALLRARRWAQRNPAVAVGLLGAIGLFVVAPSVLLWRETTHSAELQESLRKETAALRAESAALAAKAAALDESERSYLFVERLMVASDPYRSGNPDNDVREVLRAGIADLAAIEGLEESPRLEARLSLGLASACWSRGMFAEALPLAERALELERELGDELLVDDTRPLEVVVRSLGALGRYTEAEERIAAAVARDDEQNPVFRAKSQFLLGTTRLYQAKFAEAEAPFRAAFEFFCGPNPPDAESDMGVRWKLASTLSSLGRHEEAVEIIEPTLEIARDLYDEEHPAVAESQTNLAFILAGLGDMESALELQREATAKIDAFYGDESFASFRYHSDLTNLLGMARDFGEGTREAERTVAIGEALFGPDDPRTVEAKRVLSVYRTYPSSGR